MIIEYDSAGPCPGRITHVVTLHRPELGPHLLALGRVFLETEAETADPDLHHVEAGALAERPRAAITLSRTAIQADGIDSAILSGVPAGWRLAIDGVDQGEADGSAIEIVSAVAHDYAIEATGPWPFLPWQGSVQAA